LTAEVVILLRKNAKRLRTRAFGAFDSLRDDKKEHTPFGVCSFFGEADDRMSELFAIFSISSDVGMLIGIRRILTNLSLNRLLALVIRGIACINNASHQFISLPL
jgi:hypothetical protein